MTDEIAEAEWYLARDGQQFGPISDGEFKKLIELGHLQPSDLLWRDGFPDWRAASVLISNLGRPQAASQPPSVPETDGLPIDAFSTRGLPPDEALDEPRDDADQRLDGRTWSAPMPGPDVGVPEFARHGPDAAFAGHVSMMSPQLASDGLGTQPFQLTDLGPAPTAVAGARLAPLPALEPLGAPIEPFTLGAVPHGDLVLSPDVATTIGQQSPGGAIPGLHGPDLRGPNPLGHDAPGSRLAGLNQVGTGVGPDKDQRTADRARRKRPKRDAGDAARPAPGRRLAQSLARLAAMTFFIVTLAAAAWVAYPHRAKILNVFSSGPPVPPAVTAGPAGAPLKGYAATSVETDIALQKSPLWRLLKRDFPEWYQARSNDASGLVAQGRDEAAVSQVMARQIVQLRRQNAGYALGASPDNLRLMARGLVDAIAALQAQSAEACFGFVSQGETHPLIVTALKSDGEAAPIQQQLISVYVAIKDGRTTPKIYGLPKQTDFDILVAELEQRGWSQADMRLFANPQLLQQAEPARVCKLVREWFEGQLAIKDQDAQARLLVDALKPVVAG